MIKNGWTEELERLQKKVGELKKTEKWLRGLLNKSQNAGKVLRASVNVAVEEIESRCFDWQRARINPGYVADETIKILRSHGLLPEKEK